MKDWVRDALVRCGQRVTLENREGTTVIRAFLQPITEKAERQPGAVTGIGWVDTRLWLYLSDREVRPGDRLEWGGMRFCVRSSRPYYIGDELNHWWAVLEQGKEAAD